MSKQNTENPARILFERFVQLHPNKQEKYNPTFENVSRWAWHVREAENRIEGQAFAYTIDGAAQAFAAKRAFLNFAHMPKYMQEKYTELAALFPDMRVYATGSRVRGEFIEIDSHADVLEMRKRLGKSDKLESDYDISVEPKPGKPGMTIAEIKSKLPAWADVVRPVPGDRKILIPMWDFTRLPISEHAKVIELYEGKKWGALMAMHNDYALSSNHYCCNEQPIRKWFGWAIKNGLIKK